MAATNASTVLLGFSMTAFFVLVPGFLQADGFGFGLSPTSAGLLLLPFSLAMIAAGRRRARSAPSAGRVLPLRIGLVLGAASLAGLAALHANQLRVRALAAGHGRRHGVRAGGDRRARDRPLAAPRRPASRAG